MTTKQFYSELWKPILATLIPTIIIMGFTAFMAVRLALVSLQENVKDNTEDIVKREQHDYIYDKSVIDLQRDVSFIKGTLGLNNNTRGSQN